MNKKHISIPFSEVASREHIERLSALLALSNFLSTGMQLDKLLEGALSKVLEIFQLEAGRIYLIDDADDVLHLAAYQGIEPMGLEHIHIQEGFSGKAARTHAFIVQHISELEDKKRADLFRGKGLRYEDRESVCDIFKRLETSRGQRGSGLGLAIAKEIAERHKGKALAERGGDRGATFSASISKHLESVS